VPDVAQHDHRALLGGQLVKRSLDGVGEGDACRVVRSRDIGQRTRRPLSPPVPPLAVAERVDQGPVDVRVTVVCPAYLLPADVASRERGLDDIRGVVTRAAQPDGRTHQRPPARTDTR
jgi:hypothetical protein